MEHLTIRANNPAFDAARIRSRGRRNCGVLHAHRLGLGRIAKARKGGAARRNKTLTAPCRFIEILPGKCGFAGQRGATR